MAAEAEPATPSAATATTAGIERRTFILVCGSFSGRRDGSTRSLGGCCQRTGNTEASTYSMSTVARRAMSAPAWRWSRPPARARRGRRGSVLRYIAWATRCLRAARAPLKAPCHSAARSQRGRNLEMERRGPSPPRAGLRVGLLIREGKPHPSTRPHGFGPALCARRALPGQSRPTETTPGFTGVRAGGRGLARVALPRTAAKGQRSPPSVQITG